MMPSDAKLKYSRIVFDLADAFQLSDGKLSVDDALIVAATPSVIIDFANSPDADLKLVMQEMKRFLKSRSRFRNYTKEEISKGLRLEWLPTLEEDDKIRLLSDIRFITKILDEGFVDVDRDLLIKYTAAPHPDREQYGIDQYAPKTYRKGSAKGPKVVLNSVTPDVNLPLKLKPYLEWYKANWSELQDAENYKWEGLTRFKNNFDLEAQDFAKMLSDSFAPDFNLLATGSFYNPLGGIKKVAKYAPDELREAFRTLFNEEANLSQRVDAFVNTFEEIYNRLVSEGTITRTNYDKQSERSASVYLAFYYPAKYYLFKYSLWQNFKNQTDVDFPPLTHFESKLTGYQMICDQIRALLMQDNDLLALLRTSQPQDDTDGHLLTQDFLYSVAYHFVDFNLAPRC